MAKITPEKLTRCRIGWENSRKTYYCYKTNANSSKFITLKPTGIFDYGCFSKAIRDPVLENLIRFLRLYHGRIRYRLSINAKKYGA